MISLHFDNKYRLFQLDLSIRIWQHFKKEGIFKKMTWYELEQSKDDEF